MNLERMMDQVGHHTVGDEEAASYAAWCAWLERGKSSRSADLRPLEDHKAIREQEIDEFNAGVDAYKAGVKYGDLPDLPMDQNGIGWAWAWFVDNRPDLESNQSASVPPENICAIVQQIDELEDKGNGWHPDLHPGATNEAERNFRTMIAANWTAIRRYINVPKASRADSRRVSDG